MQHDFDYPANQVVVGTVVPTYPSDRLDLIELDYALSDILCFNLNIPLPTRIFLSETEYSSVPLNISLQAMISYSHSDPKIIDMLRS